MNTPQSTGRGPSFLTAPTCHRALLPSPRGTERPPAPSEGSRENGHKPPAAPRPSAPLPPLPPGCPAAKASAPLCPGPQAESYERGQGSAGSPGRVPARPPTSSRRPPSASGLSGRRLEHLPAEPRPGQVGGRTDLSKESAGKKEKVPGEKARKGGGGAGSSQSRRAP